MKIVDRSTFLALPEGTLFSKYEPRVFEELQIKGRSLPSDDFMYTEISDAGCPTNLEDTVFEMDFDTEARDGCSDQDQLFAVWDYRDVAMLIDKLRSCLIPPPPSGNELRGEPVRFESRDGLSVTQLSPYAGRPRIVRACFGWMHPRLAPPDADAVVHTRNYDFFKKTQDGIYIYREAP